MAKWLYVIIYNNIDTYTYNYIYKYYDYIYIYIYNNIYYIVTILCVCM